MTLSSLHRELDHLESRAGDPDALWGSSAIADKMSEFGDNWTYHRHELMDAAEATGQMCQGALDGFRKTDVELASSFDQVSVTLRKLHATSG